MRKDSKLAFGPGAASIILIVVILSMSILSLLTYLTARNDLALSERSAEVTEIVYGLNARAEQDFAALTQLAAQAGQQTDAWQESLARELPEGMTWLEDTISWTEENGIYELLCEVLIEEAEPVHLSWKTHRLTAQTGDPWS